MQVKKVKKNNAINSFNLSLKNAEALFLVNYTGINAHSLSHFRGEIRNIRGTKFMVIKNTLSKIAISDTSFSVASNILKGQVGVVFASDVIAVSKIIKKFCLENSKMSFLSIVSNNSLYNDRYIKELSSFNNQDEIKSTLLNILNSPAASLVRVLNEPLSGFTRVLNQHNSN